MARKSTGRVQKLHTRVTEINREWVSDVKKYAKSEAHLMDTLLTHFRRNFTKTQVKEMFNGSKSGNSVSAKVQKASGPTA